MGVLEVEAKAYEAGVLLARHLGLKNGVLEGDSLIVSNALKQVSQPPNFLDFLKSKNSFSSLHFHTISTLIHYFYFHRFWSLS